MTRLQVRTVVGRNGGIRRLILLDDRVTCTGSNPETIFWCTSMAAANDFFFPKLKIAVEASGGPAGAFIP